MLRNLAVYGLVIKISDTRSVTESFQNVVRIEFILTKSWMPILTFLQIDFKLPVDIKDEYSQLVTEVKALWLQKKNRGEIKPSGGGGSGSSAGGGDSLSGKGGGAMRQNNLAAQAVDDVGNRARKLMEARAVRFNGFLSEGELVCVNSFVCK